MTDSQLEEFLGIARCSAAYRAKVMTTVTPAKRALYENMARIEIEAALWIDGLGPKPQGVLIDAERGTKRHRAWK